VPMFWAAQNERCQMDAQQAGENIVERLAEKLGGAASVKMVYGEPVERDGTTVIPVARVRFGFGGGGGRKAGQEGEGTGGGGGVQVTPVGYIEMCEGDVAYRHIRAGSTALRLLGVGLGLWLLARPLASALMPLARRLRLREAIRALPRNQKRMLARRLKALHA